MSIKFSIKVDKAALARAFKTAEKQVDFALAKSMTKTVQDARQDLMAALPKVFDRPVPFTLRGIGYTPASKATLTATVFIREAQAKYLDIQVKGGIEHPKRRALLSPRAVPLNQYGNLPRNKVKQLLARRNVFSGTVRGIAGIWQRVGMTKVKLLIAYKTERQVKPHFDFYGIGRKSIEKNFEPNFQQALRQALATAR